LSHNEPGVSGSKIVVNLKVRIAAYFKVDVPANAFKDGCNAVFLFPATRCQIHGRLMTGETFGRVQQTIVDFGKKKQEAPGIARGFFLLAKLNSSRGAAFEALRSLAAPIVSDRPA